MRMVGLPISPATGTLSLLLATLIYSLTVTDAVVVNSGVGEILGEMINVTLRDGSQYSLARFYGIPYGQAQRFAKPTPKAKFTERFEALNYGPACPQKNPKDGNVMSEDCLSLNIFVPQAALPPLGKTADPLPVVFWIRGGRFMEGEGRTTPVQNLAAFGNVIFVTFNYRLGALGFLSTDDQKAPGNYGLWDQRLALQWVHTNIGAFGGDPNKITLYGPSIWGACVTLQAMYPPNQGLFRRIFVGSGTALSIPTLHENARDYAKALAEKVGCDSQSSAAIVSCLRQKDFTEILNADVPSTGRFDLPWAPVVDGDFIQKHPIEQVTWPPSGADLRLLRSVDAMYGICTADGSLSIRTWVKALAKQMGTGLKFGITKELFNRTVEEVLSTHDQQWDPLTKEAVLYEYTAWEDPESRSALGQSTVDLTTDKHFFIPSVLFSRNHAVNNDQANVYFFEFNEAKQDNRGRFWIHGCRHGHFNEFALGMAEERWTSEIDLNNENHTKLWELSKATMTYWSNFFKTG
ncbi:hypothetical protein BaRGS_00008595 [Batillaria attramentaria]|uniref:Carboxylesterase type B domain-containing protein n=1 Tax=Batillaria attramentaria TaxID=370345 RepID=A0ABD0LKU0_9CAEN|nr:hypothetical protein BaRGS_009294 [Batillaria attramentaria]